MTAKTSSDYETPNFTENSKGTIGTGLRWRVGFASDVTLSELRHIKASLELMLEWAIPEAEARAEALAYQKANFDPLLLGC